MRIEWTGGYVGEHQFRDEVWPEGASADTVHFVLEERGFVIAQAGVVWKQVNHEGVTYSTGGLTGVLTFPDFRGRGHGSRVVEAATQYIAERGADIGLTTSDPELRGFYARAGWTPLDGATVVYGDPDASRALDEVVLMLFLSDKGKEGRASFESGEIYVGANTW